MLLYTGGGCGGSLPGIPARDLTDLEVDQLGGEKLLLDTGLYEKEAQVGKPHKNRAAETTTENDKAE
jgi:hypothetical protein